MQQEVQLPTIEGLTAQITQMLLQRSQLKDNIEMLDKQLPVLQAQLNLLNMQEAEAQRLAAEETPED